MIRPFYLQNKAIFNFHKLFVNAQMSKGGLTYRHHVVTLHVGLVFVLALVVELPEEVEGYHGVEVHDHGQQTHSQNKLEAETVH